MSKTITGTYTAGYILSTNSFGSLNPFTISATGSIAIGASTFPAALYAQGPSVWTVTNQGKITGGSKIGVELANGGTVTNENTGTISGNYGVVLANGSGVLSNAGVISGNGQAGALLSAGGYAYNQGTISGASGVMISNAAGSVVNNGVLVGLSGNGVYLSGGTLTNRAGGVIGGVTGVSIKNGSGTVVNSGVINRNGSSGKAVDLALGFTNRVVVNPGASFYGTVDGGNAPGGGAISTLEFASSNQQASLTGLGTQFIDFSQITFDPGSDWSLTGSNTIQSGVTLFEQGHLRLVGESLQNAAVTTISSAGATGAVVDVTGASAVWAETAPMVIGSNGGGTFNVTNRAQAGAQGAGLTAALTLGAATGGNGLLSVSGVGSKFTANGQLTLGQAGTGNITVASQGTVTAKRVNIGVVSGSNGNLLLTGVQSLLSNTGPFFVGDGGLGSASIQAGATIVTTQSGAVGAVIATQSSASGSSVNVTGAGSNWQVNGSLIVGNAGFGSLSVSNGATVSATMLDEGVLGSGSGVVSVSNATLNLSGNLIIGDGSTGEFSVLNNGSVTAANGNIGSGASGSGNLDIEGTSHVTFSNGLTVGATGFGALTVGLNAELTTQNFATGVNGNVNILGVLDPATISNAGLITLNGGSLIATTSWTNDGTFVIKNTESIFAPFINEATIGDIGLWQINQGASLIVNVDTVDVNQIFAFASKTSGTLVIGQVSDHQEPATIPVNSPNVLSNFHASIANYRNGGTSNDQILFNGLTYTSNIVSGNTLTVFNNSTALGTLTFTDTFGSADNTGAAQASAQIACFAGGTMIETNRGPVAVEDLCEGDGIVTHDGRARTVRWIGYRHMDLSRHSTPALVCPVHIAVGAFATNVPDQALRVSPDHALFVDGKLVPARLLVNGASIRTETRCTEVTYYHVELDEHDILLANGMPAESYLDTGNRSMFANGGGAVRLHPVFDRDPTSPRARETHSHAPFVTEAEMVRPIWESLERRARKIGFAIQPVRTTDDPMPRLQSDGKDIRPIRVSEGTYQFVIPGDAREVRLLSRAARPCDARPWIEDRRILGLSIERIRIRQGRTLLELALDGPAPGQGWWDVEHDARGMSRWTNGDAAVTLPASAGAVRVLEITMGCGMVYTLDDSEKEAIRAVA